MRFPSFSPRRINQKNQKERHNFLLEKRKKSQKGNGIEGERGRLWKEISPALALPSLLSLPFSFLSLPSSPPSSTRELLPSR
jgi:hypothetical protein